MEAVIPTRIVPSVAPSGMTTRQVAREFQRRLDDGMELRPVGEARRDPSILLCGGYAPRYKIELFDTVYYLGHPRQNEDIRFFVAYVVQDHPRKRTKRAHPRIFYKDLSLVWRSASHFVRSETENWIGKGDLTTVIQDGEEVLHSLESTTDLPLEIQTALETLNRAARRIPHDEVALELVLHRGPDDRLAPYRDFTEPRRRARSNPRNLIHGGRRIAFFRRKDDPTSLRFVAGFEPDFEMGIVEVGHSRSKMYGGALKRFRILSRNQRIQYLFIAGPHHVWIIPPQATTSEIMSYGVRTIDVVADEDVFIPGYEYHFVDHHEDPPVLHSQIPPGYAGEPCEADETRADASRWLEALPVIQEFRRKVLASGSDTGTESG